VIVSNASPATGALQRETQTIPIVFAGVADPIGSGFVASLAQPGANITGFLLFEASVTGKWLAMLRDMVPALARATLVINPKTAPYYEFYLRAAQAAASSLGIELVFGPIGDAHTEIESAFEAFARTWQAIATNRHPGLGRFVAPAGELLDVGNLELRLLAAETSHHNRRVVPAEA
jgi:putative ABC transport system substrate-binding protein